MHIVCISLGMWIHYLDLTTLRQVECPTLSLELSKLYSQVGQILSN